MKRFFVAKDKGIIDGKYQEGWRVYERIGKPLGKKASEELYPGALYKTKKEALANCPHNRKEQ